MGTITCWEPPPFERMTEADYNHLVHIRRFDVQPPSRVYVTVDDVLEFSIYAPITSTTVNLSIRTMLPSGEVNIRFETYTLSTTGATPTVEELAGVEGFLLSATVETPGAPRGQCFVSLRIKRGRGSGDVVYGEVVLQGYPGSSGSLGYPGMFPYSSLEGRGRMRVITVANPVAGADFTLAVPAGVSWFVRGMSALFTTSATVAVRVPQFQFTDASANILFISDGFVQPAAEAFIVVGNVGLPPFTQAPTIAPVGLPFDLRLLSGWIVGSLTLGIDAGDQWSAIVVTVEEFIAG